MLFGSASPSVPKGGQKQRKADIMRVARSAHDCGLLRRVLGRLGFEDFTSAKLVSADSTPLRSRCRRVTKFIFEYSIGGISVVLPAHICTGV